MEDHFAAMDVIECREEYWGEDINDFSNLVTQPVPDETPKDLTRQVQDSSFFFDLFQQPDFVEEPEAVTRQLQDKDHESTADSRELQFDHYNLAASWTLELPPLLLPEEYVVGQMIQLNIGFTDSTCSFAGENLLVEVLQLLGQPWKSGCVMLVRCLNSPQQEDVGGKFVLKLVDLRFCLPAYETDTSIHSLQRFVDMMCCGTAQEFLQHLLADPTKGFPPGEWFEELSNWQKLVALSHQAHLIAREEATVYQHLKELQGYHIPKFYHEVCTRPWIELLPSATQLVKSSGFLIEYIEGDTFEVFERRWDQPPRGFCSQTYDEVIRACNIFEYYGFDHASLSGRNIILRKEPKEDGSRVVFINFYRHCIRKAEEGYGQYLDYWVNPETDLEWAASTYMYDDYARVNATWNHYLYTGRMSERGMFPTHSLTDPEAAAPRTIARIRYRVIMDDIWHVDQRPILDDDLKHKALLSRIAYNIIREEAGLRLSREDWPTWYLRALPRIADRLGYESDGLLERFERNFQAYMKRPNSGMPTEGNVATLDTPVDGPDLPIIIPDESQNLASCDDSSISSLSSSASTRASSRTSLDSLDTTIDEKLFQHAGRIFVQKPGTLVDFHALGAELKAALDVGIKTPLERAD